MLMEGLAAPFLSFGAHRSLIESWRPQKFAPEKILPTLCSRPAKQDTEWVEIFSKQDFAGSEGIQYCVCKMGS